MNKRDSSANMRIELLMCISEAGFLLVVLEPVEGLALWFRGKNDVAIEIGHLGSLTLKLGLYLILTHSLRGMKLTFNLPAIDGGSLGPRSALRCLGIVRFPGYLGSFLIHLKWLIDISLVLLMVKTHVDERFILLILILTRRWSSI